MDITSYTRVQDGITSRANQCLNLYLLKRDKSKFWWILQLPAYQHQRGSAGFVITAYNEDNDVIVVIVIVVIRGGRFHVALCSMFVCLFWLGQCLARARS